jgi:hypothetical protein
MKNAIRWILALPLGILSMLAVTAIFRIGNMLFPSHNNVSDAMISFWCGAAFTFVCGSAVPAYSRVASVVAGFLFVLVAFWVITPWNNSVESMILWAAAVVGAAAGIFVLFRGNW